MITKVFSLYDSKAKSFGPPFYMLTKGMAIRALSDLVKDEQSMVSRHPEDFVLYQIGEFNDQKGEFSNINPHDHLAIAKEFERGGKEVIQVVQQSRETVPMVQSENNKEKESA